MKSSSPSILSLLPMAIGEGTFSLVVGGLPISVFSRLLPSVLTWSRSHRFVTPNRAAAASGVSSRSGSMSDRWSFVLTSVRVRYKTASTSAAR
jgi:hypothetical protein